MHTFISILAAVFLVVLCWDTLHFAFKEIAYRPRYRVDQGKRYLGSCILVVLFAVVILYAIWR